MHGISSGVLRGDGHAAALHTLGDQPKPWSDAGSGWSPVDLAPVLAGEYQDDPPSLLRRADELGLLYSGRVHSLAGEPESGKTALAHAACAERIRAAEPVVYFDFESDARQSIGWLRALGVPDEAIREGFSYIRPTAPVGDGDRKALADLASSGPSLVVIDAVNDALALHGQDSYTADSASALDRLLVRPFAEKGAAVLLLDHVVKRKEERGRWAYGSQAKLALADVAFQLQVRQPFGRGRDGTAELLLTKDRPGFLRGLAERGDDTRERIAVVSVRSRDGGKVNIELEPPNPETSLDALGLKPYQRSLIDALSSFDGAGARAEEVRDVLEAKGHPFAEKTVRDRLERLVRLGTLDRAGDRYLIPSRLEGVR